jgi:hypothetical protein
MVEKRRQGAGLEHHSRHIAAAACDRPGDRLGIGRAHAAPADRPRLVDRAQVRHLVRHVQSEVKRHGSILLLEATLESTSYQPEDGPTSITPCPQNSGPGDRRHRREQPTGNDGLVRAGAADDAAVGARAGEAERFSDCGGPTARSTGCRDSDDGRCSRCALHRCAMPGRFARRSWRCSVDRRVTRDDALTTSDRRGAISHRRARVRKMPARLAPHRGDRRP